MAGFLFASFVMAGLVPAIHDLKPDTAAKAWMPGRGPGMTAKIHLPPTSSFQTAVRSRGTSAPEASAAFPSAREGGWSAGRRNIVSVGALLRERRAFRRSIAATFGLGPRFS
jgi:hypothetical protein